MKTTTVYLLLGLTVFSIAVVVILFLSSEHEVHRNNAFMRRYPHHPITKKYNLEIKYNSYYLAGYENHNLYLGNATAPLHVLKVNLQTKDTAHIRIDLEPSDEPFRAVKVKLVPPYFFVMDGSVPCIYRGRIGVWKAKVWMKDVAFFSKGIPIANNKFFIRAISVETKKSVLGLLSKSDDFDVNLNPELLEEQIDGVFDVDGKMLASENGDMLAYVYYYRNQFFVMDSNLKLLAKNETIDTIRNAQIQLTSRNSKGEIEMSAPPIIVNKTAALWSDKMLIHSDRIGKYEKEEMRAQAAIIDVYHWKSQTYEFSFYIYKIKGKTLREFNLYDNYVVALIHNSLSVYHLKETYFKRNVAETVSFEN